MGASCPGNMELINQKCYLHGVATSREDALKQCKAADPNNHLWIINHKLEMDQVMEWFSKKLISPWAWTDGIKKPHEAENIWIWESTGARISYEPDAEEGTICDGHCVSDDCATAPMGDCVALSMNDVGTRSYQGCSCDEGGIGFICESADEVDFDCPADGFFPSAPCSDLWYNCWAGHATPEYCENNLIFNPEAGYCDFPENNPNC